MKKLRVLFVFIVCIFYSQFSYSQLPAFNLLLTATNETCTANGSLSFTVTNTTPGAIILYRVYKLPDITTPIAVTNTNSFGGLTAGTYRVIAIQSSGNLSNTQQQDIQITNLIVPVSFQIVSQPALYCGQTGTITVNTTQGNPVTYEIISGPMLFPPQTSNVFTGLLPGEYDIRVNDNCSDGVVQTHFLPAPGPNLTVALTQGCGLLNCTTKEITVTVSAAANTAIGYPLQVQLTVFPPNSAPLILNQTITSGDALLSLISFTIPYHNVASYLANIRVVDACGNIKVLNNTALDVAPKINLTTQAVTSCTEEINVSLCNMLPPFRVVFLEAPAGFIPGNFNVNNLGPFSDPYFTYASNPQHELPTGNYVIQVTDACGTIVQGSVEVKKAITDHKLVAMYEGCVLKYYVFIPDAGIKIETVVLTSAPPGYSQTLPQNLTSTISGGIFSMELPLPGIYVFTGINLCGDTYIRTVQVIPPDPILLAEGSTINGCLSSTGKITVSLSGAPPIASVIVTQAPSAFNPLLPYDASAFIVPPSSCVIPGLPVGDYTIVVTDICGKVYPPIVATVSPGIADAPATVAFLRGCENGMGSIKMTSANGKFVQVSIILAPPEYNQALPYDVSFNILASTGVFYMNSLPQGTYVFYTKDICGMERQETIVMLGHGVTQNTINVIGNCGSFNLLLNHVAYQPNFQSFWLQRLNPITNQWEHPITGISYPDGTVPSPVNSYQVFNFSTNFNIASLGTFRILKYYLIYSNGSAAFASCYDVIKEFDFTGELKIVSTGAVPCGADSNDVFIETSGIAPFTYLITSKNGQPFLVNNGTSNIFTGLAPGIYNFQVKDVCGNIVNRLLDITTLSEPTIVASDLCVGENGQLSVQAISFLSYRWWKGTDTGNVLSTTNILNFTPFSNALSPGTYYVRIYSETNLSCIDKTISYVVPAISDPNAGLDNTRIMCGNAEQIDLFSLLGAPFDADGIWEETTNSGMLTGSTWSPEGIVYGTYKFDYTVTTACGVLDTATITIRFNPIPDIPLVSASPAFCSEQEIQLHVDTIPNATFQWFGPNGFTATGLNPVIQNSTIDNSGLYTVIATVNGCESRASIEVTVLPIPDFDLDASCINGVYTVSVKPNRNSFEIQNATYLWTGPSNFTSTDNPIQITGLMPGFYEVTVTNSDGCPTTNGVQISNTRCSTTIPNVITPNDDSNNDTFDLTGLDVDRIEIYSRWGRLIYEQNNYTNQWYGQNMDGKELPDSTYYYILYFRTGTEKQGWVYKSTWR